MEYNKQQRRYRSTGDRSDVITSRPVGATKEEEEGRVGERREEGAGGRERRLGGKKGSRECTATVAGIIYNQVFIFFWEREGNPSPGLCGLGLRDEKC